MGLGYTTLPLQWESIAVWIVAMSVTAPCQVATLHQLCSTASNEAPSDPSNTTAGSLGTGLAQWYNFLNHHHVMAYYIAPSTIYLGLC